MAIDVRDAEHEELKALNLVLKFICGKPVKLGSVTSALFSLLISQRYQVTAFTRLCLEYLLQKIDASNVLDICHTISSFTSLCSCKKNFRRRRESQDDSETPADNKDNDANEVYELFEKLAFTCLQTIDIHAEELLGSEDFLLLSPKMVQFVIKRDTLCVSSESLIIAALNSWCVHRCSRRGAVATLKNKNKILQDLKLHVRWLTLTPAELEIAQTQYGLLTSKEYRALMMALEHINCSCPLPARLEGRRDQMRNRRCGLDHFKNVDKRKKIYCHDEIDEIKKGLKKSHSDVSEGIYESIKDFPIQPIWRDETFKGVGKSTFESSCLNLGNHDDYRLLRNHQSKENILEEEEDKDMNKSFHHLIHCFSCLFD